MPHLDDLIELGDPDELLREIDRLCDRRAWDDLAQLRTRCLLAVERGRQLWGVAGHAAYRLALQADAEHAAAVLEAESPPFLLGPLTEVMASSHAWMDLAPHLPDIPQAGIIGYERVLRGEDLTSDLELQQHAALFEMPLRLQSWEPQYPLAEYHDKEALFPAPQLHTLETISFDVVADVSLLDESETRDALVDLVSAWTAESNGVARAAIVEGDMQCGLSALGIATHAVARVPFADALAMMAWAAASGGAHGRRSGMANGRAKAWWALAAMLGLADVWPVDPLELGEYGEQLDWYTWDVGDLSKGWHLRFVAVDSQEKLAFALDARDVVS